MIEASLNQDITGWEASTFYLPQSSALSD